MSESSGTDTHNVLLNAMSFSYKRPEMLNFIRETAQTFKSTDENYKKTTTYANNNYIECPFDKDEQKTKPFLIGKLSKTPTFD